MTEPTALNANQTLGQLAAAFPVVIPKLFEKELDFCCGGDRSLAQACAERRLDSKAILQELNALVRERNTPTGSGLGDWSSDRGGALIDFILERFHEGHRAAFPGLQKMMAKVAGVHGEHHPFLGSLETAVQDLIAELEPHMRKEELVLFPLMRYHFGEIQKAPLACSGTDPAPPMRMMRQEHETAGEILAKIRSLTHDFQLPEGACTTFTNLYTTLADLDREIRLHIHLENNVLFPMIEALTAHSEQNA